jgi:hypothetical protein
MVADGMRGFDTFAVFSALAAMALVYHLRYANRLREVVAVGARPSIVP